MTAPRYRLTDPQRAQIRRAAAMLRDAAGRAEAVIGHVGGRAFVSAELRGLRSEIDHAMHMLWAVNDKVRP